MKHIYAIVVVMLVSFTGFSMLDAARTRQQTVQDEKEQMQSFFTVCRSGFGSKRMGKEYRSKRDFAKACIKKFGINVTDDRGQTPLMKAASVRNAGMVQFLLKKGANPLLCDENDHSALFYAKKHLEVCADRSRATTPSNRRSSRIGDQQRAKMTKKIFERDGKCIQLLYQAEKQESMLRLPFEIEDESEELSERHSSPPVERLEEFELFAPHDLLGQEGVCSEGIEASEQEVDGDQEWPLLEDLLDSSPSRPALPSRRSTSLPLALGRCVEFPFDQSNAQHSVAYYDGHSILPAVLLDTAVANDPNGVDDWFTEDN